MAAQSEYTDPALLLEVMVANQLAIHVVNLEAAVVSFDTIFHGASCDEDILMSR